MKKVKKLLALVMAMTMVLGMAISVSAAPSTEKGTATVMGVTEEGAQVTAYQMVTYDDTGVYSVVPALEGKYTVGEDDAAVITSIASDTALLGQLNAKNLTDTDGDGNWTAELTAGTYLVLVTGTGEAIYNPMLLSLEVTYEAGGVGDGEVDADGDYVVNDVVIYAKSTESVPVDKKITGVSGTAIGVDNLGKIDDVSGGDTVYFTITTKIPSYSDLYDNENLTFKLTDTADERLTLDNENGKLVEAIQNCLEDDAANVTVNGQVITVEFKREYILANGGETITITYPAVVEGKDEDALLTKETFEAVENSVVLEYSNTPTETTKSDPSVTKHYTFDFLVYKTDATTHEQLVGAEFSLTNTVTNETITSTYDKYYQQHRYIFGDVDAGTYILKETKAPAGYSLSNEEYTVKVTPFYGTGKNLMNYTVEIRDSANRQVGLTTYQLIGGGVAIQNASDLKPNIPNTELASLPSTGGIGTTIFTIGGCAIMIAAAALYFVNRRKSEEN
ncbi:isopeptide-forming domain-containing fimbrial protein [Lachnoclostridium sp. An138]|uniref:isopeptide-forming domain-containing fimbrial protein n=1 Tax=Lachnoclostridium sp. An138 TaxID=1965560 RepID=UPI000B3AFBAA|nr:isopeptide-forming domain-containing fimbrial protein [Lachnoclostridium sp. An138]OUQ15927.1 hypothetical protein B5E82_14560 [Lachnoclostridium sp. An138]